MNVYTYKLISPNFVVKRYTTSGVAGVDHKSRSRVEAYERATLMRVVEATCYRAGLFVLST